MKHKSDILFYFLITVTSQSVLFLISSDFRVFFVFINLKNSRNDFVPDVAYVIAAVNGRSLSSFSFFSSLS